MADDEEQDPFSSITDNCRYSSSQEEILSHAIFARVDETFSDDEKPPAAMDLGLSLRKLDGAEDSCRRRRGEFVAVVADSARAKNLGFRGERKGSREGEASGTNLEAFCGGKGGIEPQLKKFKVSPRIHCSGKLAIEETDDDDVLVLRGDLKVEMTSSSRSIVPENIECTGKLDSEDVEDGVHIEGEMSLERGGKKKLECSWETEVIDLTENEEEIMRVNREECNAAKEGKGDREVSGIVDNEKQGDGTSTREEKEEDITRRGKRELPRSMIGLVWGERTGDGFGNGNEEIENRDMEDGLKEASVERKRDGEFKIKGGEKEEAIRCILDVLRVFSSEKCSNDGNEIDVFETVKLRGMTFPRSRFLPEVEEKE